MTTLEVILLILVGLSTLSSGVLFVLVCILSFAFYKSSLRSNEYEAFLEELNDTVKNSLIAIRAREEEIKQRMVTPVMFDDPVVRNILYAIKKTYEEINKISSKLSLLVQAEEEPEILDSDKTYIIDFLNKEEKEKKK